MQDSGRGKINKVVHWNLWILRDGLKKLEAIASVSQVPFFFFFFFFFGDGKIFTVGRWLLKCFCL